MIFFPYIFIQKQFYACKCEQRHQVVRLFIPKALRMCPTWAVNSVTKHKRKKEAILHPGVGHSFAYAHQITCSMPDSMQKIHFRCRKVALLASKFCETIKDRSVWSIHNMNICVLLCLWLMRIGCHKKWWYFCSFLRSFVCLLFVYFFFHFSFHEEEKCTCL